MMGFLYWDVATQSLTREWLPHFRIFQDLRLRHLLILQSIKPFLSILIKPRNQQYSLHLQCHFHHDDSYMVKNKERNQHLHQKWSRLSSLSIRRMLGLVYSYHNILDHLCSVGKIHQALVKCICAKVWLS